MNDPGLEEPIANDADDVEKQKGETQSGKNEGEQAFLEPRYAACLFMLMFGFVSLILGKQQVLLGIHLLHSNLSVLGETSKM